MSPTTGTPLTSTTRDLLRPKWLIATVLVLVLAAVFVRLGIWQLDRHTEVTAANAEGIQRISQPAIDLEQLIEEAHGDNAAIEYRRARIGGVFDPDAEVLVRSQVHLGNAGFHVITPLVLDDGSAVLVNRGWIPLTMDTVPVSLAPPPAGQTVVEGWIQQGRERPPLGPEDPPGRLAVVNRVDIARIQQQVDRPLAPVYLVESGEPGALPEPLSKPTFDDNGPHLGYAIQWFGFAMVGLIGFAFLVKRRSGQSSARFSTTSNPETPDS